jgi:hypothetical protein
MSAQRRWLSLVAAAALAIGLSGCGLLPAANDNSAKLHQEAQADLGRWAAAVPSSGAQSAFVPVGELTSQVGDWEESVGDNNKVALMSGAVEADVSLPTDTPPDGEVRWQDGTATTVGLLSAQAAFSALKSDAGGGACADCTPLRITAARLATGPVQTSRGAAVAPVWEFTLEGTAVRVTRVAVAGAVAAAFPTWNPNDVPVGISIESATGTPDGRQLTVGFTGAPVDAGGCGADYTAEAVESNLAIVVIVTEHRHMGFGACSAVGAFRTAEVELAAPLGNRAVLEVREGRPVSVTPKP